MSQQNHPARDVIMSNAVVVLCLLPFAIYYGFVWGRIDACIAVVATFFSVYLATTPEKHRILSIVGALLAVAFSPWKILTVLALLPCLMDLFCPNVQKKPYKFVAEGLILGFVTALWLLGSAAFTPNVLKTSLISPRVVENAFNVFSVLGLNLFPAVSTPFQISAIISGIAALLFIFRFQDPVQKGACMALAASLILPGQTLASSAAAVGVIAVGASKNRTWARLTCVLALTLFSEVYMVKRWSLYAQRFSHDWNYDPSLAVSPLVIALVLTKLFVFVRIWQRESKYLSSTLSSPFITWNNAWQNWPKACLREVEKIVRQTPAVNRSDLIKILTLLTVSVLLSFYHLGAFTKPETFVSGNLRWKVSIAPDQKIEDVWIYKSRHAAQLRVTCDQDDTAQDVTFVTIEAYGWAYRKLIAPCLSGATFELKSSVNARLFELYLADGEGKRVLPKKICTAGEGDDCRQSLASQLFDESMVAPGIPTQLHGSYYDEAFHIEDGIQAYGKGEGADTTNPAHPFFGRAMIALSMKSFGPIPFSWRLPDALAGALIPLLTLLLAWRIFARKDLAFFAAFLVLCDTGRITLSRVATTDSQLSFWILVQAIGIWEWLRSCALSQSQDQSKSPEITWLIIAGTGLGCAAGIKWSGVFLLPVLALVLTLASAASKKPFRALITSGIIVIVVASFAYSAGYAAIIDQWDISLFKLIATDAVRMLGFHQAYAGYVPYQSQFVEWPWVNRPVALFAGYGLPASKILKLFIVGNPFIYWAILPAIYVACKSRLANTTVGNLFAVVCFLSLFAVWGLIGRLTFLYHFVPIVPFGAIVIASVLHAPHIPFWGRPLYMSLVGVGLFMFLPLALGLIVPKELLSISEWFPAWFGLFDFHTRFLLGPLAP